MEQYTTRQLQEMRDALQEIGDTSKSVLQRAQRSVEHIAGLLSELRAFISKYRFSGEDEEILFFKEIKPKYLECLYYYQELFYLESAKPIGTEEVVVGYYEKKLEWINCYIERNHALYIYYKTGRTDKDKEYFLRASNLPNEIQCGDLDPAFSTGGSNVLSMILALEQLCEYISATVRKVYRGENMDTNVPEVALQWTDTKAGLIELLYGLHEKGCFNNGKAELKQVARLLETACKVDLGNYSRTFQEIRIRKKNRTAFLDGIKEMFEQRMDKADGF